MCACRHACTRHHVRLLHMPRAVYAHASIHSLRQPTLLRMGRVGNRTMSKFWEVSDSSSSESEDEAVEEKVVAPPTRTAAQFTTPFDDSGDEEETRVVLSKVYVLLSSVRRSLVVGRCPCTCCIHDVSCHRIHTWLRLRAHRA